MLLAVDVGNTHTVLGLYEGSTLVHDFRIETSKGRTMDEYHVLLLNLLQVANVPRASVRASILASVVPTLNDTLIEAVDRAFDHEILVVGPGIKTGMPILYENPREVGADRIVNAVAAYERVEGQVIVVDFGTATTFDCISAKGEYLGGAIAPGMQISAHALFDRRDYARHRLRRELRLAGRRLALDRLGRIGGGIEPRRDRFLFMFCPAPEHRVETHAEEGRDHGEDDDFNDVVHQQFSFRPALSP